jgi:hypothetical protein
LQRYRSQNSERSETELKRALRRSRILLGLLVTLALGLSMVMAVPVMAQPTFTGNVENDFTGPGVLTFVDPPDVTPVIVPAHPVTNTSSGWDIKDVRLVYDPATDILYVGLNSYETVGDADTDGNEGFKSYGPGWDIPNLGLGESVSVYFDLDQNGSWDVIAGVPSDTDFSGFTVKSAIGNTTTQAFFGTTDLTAHLGIKYWTPSSAPDLEFQILDFSDLPNQGGALTAFTLGAFMGSTPDSDIVEDLTDGPVSLPPPPAPVGGTALPVNKLGLVAPWAVLLGCAAVAAASMLSKRRQA